MSGEGELQFDLGNLLDQLRDQDDEKELRALSNSTPQDPQQRIAGAGGAANNNSNTDPQKQPRPPSGSDQPFTVSASGGSSALGGAPLLNATPGGGSRSGAIGSASKGPVPPAPAVDPMADLNSWVKENQTTASGSITPTPNNAVVSGTTANASGSYLPRGGIASPMGMSTPPQGGQPQQQRSAFAQGPSSVFGEGAGGTSSSVFGAAGGGNVGSGGSGFGGGSVFGSGGNHMGGTPPREGVSQQQALAAATALALERQQINTPEGSTPPFALKQSGGFGPGTGSLGRGGGGMDRGGGLDGGGQLLFGSAQIQSSPSRTYGPAGATGGGGGGGGGSNILAPAQLSPQPNFSSMDRGGMGGGPGGDRSTPPGALHPYGGRPPQQPPMGMGSGVGGGSPGSGLAALGLFNIPEEELTIEQQRQQIQQLNGRMVEAAKDQGGCRVLQHIMENPFDSDEVQTVLKEILPNVAELMEHPYGNFLIQKLLDVAPDTIRLQITGQIAPHLPKVATTQHGTFAVQKLIESFRSAEERKVACEGLATDVTLLMTDGFGAHVVQKLLACLPCPDRQFLYDGICTNTVPICNHKHGTCIVQRCIENSNQLQQHQVLQAVVKEYTQLIINPYGNYVMQFLMEHLPIATSQFVRRLVEHSDGDIVFIATSKFGSNVVETALKRCPPDVASLLIQKVCHLPTLQALVLDRYGNYVIQTALVTASNSCASLLIAALLPMIGQIRQQPYGRKLEGKLEAAMKRTGYGKSAGNSPTSYGSPNFSSAYGGGGSSGSGGGIGRSPTGSGPSSFLPSSNGAMGSNGSLSGLGGLTGGGSERGGFSPGAALGGSGSGPALQQTGPVPPLEPSAVATPGGGSSSAASPAGSVPTTASTPSGALPATFTAYKSKEGSPASSKIPIQYRNKHQNMMMGGAGGAGFGAGGGYEGRGGNDWNSPYSGGSGGAPPQESRGIYGPGGNLNSPYHQDPLSSGGMGAGGSATSNPYLPSSSSPSSLSKHPAPIGDGGSSSSFLVESLVSPSPSKTTNELLPIGSDLPSAEGSSPGGPPAPIGNGAPGPIGGDFQVTSSNGPSGAPLPADGPLFGGHGGNRSGTVGFEGYRSMI